LVLGGCRWAEVGGLADRQVGDHTLTYAGLERTYTLRIPAGYADDEPMPLVLELHGGGGNGPRMCSTEGGVHELAEQVGFIVACPDGVQGNWNDGRAIDRYRAHAEHIDDVGFLLALVDQLAASYSIDRERLFVTGPSNGGMMTLRLACEAPGTFAAAAAIIASLPADLDCQPAQPISILLMNGTEDPLMPYDGGQVRFFRQELGGVISTADTVAFWVAANDCDPTPVSEHLPDLDPQDATRTRVDRYTGCADGVSVVLYEVAGGGHTLPGGAQYAPRFVIGRVSRDFHAGEAVWGFFEPAAR
jgi:polyhydroxybutyrate depolymerase